MYVELAALPRDRIPDSSRLVARAVQRARGQRAQCAVYCFSRCQNGPLPAKFYQMSKPLGHNRRVAAPSAQVRVPVDSPQAEADRCFIIVVCHETTPLPECLFRVATSCPLGEESLRILPSRVPRAAGSTSSGGSTTEVRTYCNREFVRATCVST